MNPIKKYSVLVLVAVALIVVFQNAGAVTVRFLLWDFSMSKALLLPVVLGLGLLIGWLISGWRR
ncbi:MAG TPA: lipopolysaccharide assembly protein LapA domain-containing protein [Kiritimatiellia bacterium]|nr:lipopolysaccharide assembly protein LapA domain-containing protein [Kiritimatiellia bacterium]HMO99183.1 lipopolysaccharide assembly protein LapA domain-containing protein [Kiritimatiellia bacterium]